jgi:hypothetical protein
MLLTLKDLPENMHLMVAERAARRDLSQEPPNDIVEYLLKFFWLVHILFLPNAQVE